MTPALFWLLMATRAAAVDYFLSPAGKDTNDGLSRGTAWRTIQRVNERVFAAGDTLRFESGRRFEGNLRLRAGSVAAGGSGLTVTSTAAEPAVLFGGLGVALHSSDLGGLVLSNLVVEGAGPALNTNHGILCDNTLGTRRRVPNLTLTGVTVRGFGLQGLSVSGGLAGYEHVRISGCVFAGNRRGGMEMGGRLAYNSPMRAHRDVEITECQFSENPGDPKFFRSHSGSGLTLYEVDGGLVERCKAWGNGAEGNNKRAGGVGIWVCASRGVTIQHCESYANRTQGVDGGGFDIDGGCESCILQHNYSHDNDGPGLMVYAYPYAPFPDHGNIVRHNRSENDSRKSRYYAGLWIQTDGGPMTGLEVHDNTVVVGDWTAHAAFICARGIQGNVYSNVFVAAGAAVPLHLTEAHPGMRLFGNQEQRLAAARR